MAEQWGVGKKSDAKAYRTVAMQVGHGDKTVPVELIMGEHPHSRQDNSTYARLPDGTIYGFSGHQILTSLHFEEFNYLKESELSGDEVRRAGRCQIAYNGYVAYSFFFRDVEDALLRAHRLLIDLPERAALYFDAFVAGNVFSLIGHKLYYDRTPAVVSRVSPDQGEITLDVDLSAGALEFPRHVSSDPDEEDYYDPDERKSVRVDVMSNSIYWYRK